MLQVMHALLLVAALAAPQAPEAEVKVVEYLKANTRPGQRAVVSRLYNEIFTTDAERVALNRLFNTFFKLPLYMAQHQKAAGKPPTLAEISEQFSFRVPGEADVLVRIMESDPRMPQFVTRNPVGGEIASVDVDRILAHPRFGKALERTIAGWEGRPAPAFATTDYGGGRPLGCTESPARRPVMCPVEQESVACADSEVDRRVVAALDTQFQAAVKRNDAETMARILHADFVLVTGNGKTFTREELLREATRREITYERQDEDAGTQAVRVWGDTAVVTARLWIKGVRDGVPFDRRLWFSDTYVRTLRGWRYAFGQASLRLPPEAAEVQP
jgi:ketosteroid isomerase-like protein